VTHVTGGPCRVTQSQMGARRMLDQGRRPHAVALAEGGIMAGTSHARRSSHTGIIAVLLVGFLVVLTAAALVFTSRGSGDSPSAPTPVVHAVIGPGVEACTWHRNGWYC
jgi:hypothetical protein